MPKKYTDKALIKALSKSNGNNAKAGKILGVSRQNVRYRRTRLTPKQLNSCGLDTKKNPKTGAPKKYSDDDLINALKETGGNLEQTASILGCSTGSVQSRGGNIDPNLYLSPSQLISTYEDTEIDDYETIVITWAQNATKVHTRSFNTIHAYCEENGFKLIILPGTYRPNGVIGQINSKVLWWDEIISDHLVDDKIKTITFGNYKIYPKINIVATAITPLTSFEGLSGPDSTIIGHPKRSLAHAPVLGNQDEKVMSTTMAITEPNYSHSKAGALSEFHHIIGAAQLTKMKNGRCKLSHLVCDTDGSFSSDGYHYSLGSDRGLVKNNSPVEALILGDLHATASNKHAIKQCVKQIRKLNPKRIVIHDCFDWCNVSHWNGSFLKVRYAGSEKGAIQYEFEKTIKVLKKLAAASENPSEVEIVLVASNHNDWIERFLESADWKSLTHNNAQKYLDWANKKIRDPDFNLYEYEMRDCGLNITHLTRHDSYMVEGFSLDQHGDERFGGGTNYIKSSTKMVVGHSHSPKIDRGMITVGTQTNRRQAYNKAAISNGHANCAVYKGGKAELLIYEVPEVR